MKKILVFLLILALIALLAGGIFMVRSKDAKVPETAGQAVHAVPTPTPKPTSSSPGLTNMVNILLIGVDNINGLEEDSRANADGTILATINPDTKEIIFTSFMRDTRVRIENGYDKITNVFHVGGEDRLCEVLRQNFEIPIDYHATFSYIDIADIVDAVGGVDLELSAEEIYFMESKIRGVSSDTGTNYEDNALDVDQAGMLTLNGVQAAAYMRIRPAEGGYDAGRTERARNVIEAVLKKAFRLKTADMLAFANVFYEKVKTNIPDSVFLDLASNASDLRKYEQISDRIPIDGSYESGNTGSGYYVIPDFEVNNKHLKDSIYNGIHS